MAITKLTIEEFLQLSIKHPVLDVRSPSEFTHAHIPGAYSLPLFTDEERKVVGTAYKQESKQKAIKLGLKYFGKKMVKMVEEVEGEIKNYELRIKNKENGRRLTVDDERLNQIGIDYEKIVLVHCWRGGMRSAGVAWLLDLYGFKVYTLVGGYKAYRKWVLQQFTKEYNILIIGGYTGSGKTEVLHELATRGQQVINLEALANHKGSAFGSFGQPPQPTQEQFENYLAKELQTVDRRPLTVDENSSFGLPSTVHRPPSIVFIEDESQRIGEVIIPTIFFQQMRRKQVYFLDIPFDERLQYIMQGYGKFEKEKMVNAIIRIKKRLGGLETKTAINCLIENDVQGCFALLLKYYDKVYSAGSLKREHPDQLIQKIPCSKVNAVANAIKLIEITTNQPAINNQRG